MASASVCMRPESQGVQFTARPALRTRDSMSQSRTSSRLGRASSVGSQGLLGGEGGEFVPQSTNASMSIIEVEAALREKARSKFDNLRQAFKMYDVDENETVTRGEFRRVLESYCMPLTTEQFDAIAAKVGSSTNKSTINYVDFLTKFHGGDATNRSPQSYFIVITFCRSGPPAPREVNMDMIEKLLRDRINANFRAVVRGLQLFDYNMDGKVQRHELRRVLENYCFKFTDQQYDKLWLRYDFHHTGLVNYRDFLKRLGVNVRNSSIPPAGNTAAGGECLSQVSKVATTQLKTQQKEDAKLLKSLTFDQIEIEFRKRMRSNYLKLKKAFMTFDRHLDGFIEIGDLRSILNSFTLPMSDQLFMQLMERCGVKASGRVAWEIFLENFQNPVTVGNGQTLPIRNNHRIHPIMETQKVVDWDAIWNQLYRRVQSHFNSLKEAFLQMDKNRDGRVTKREFRELIEKFTFRLDDRQFKELMTRVDPDHNSRVDYHTFLRLFEEKETKEGHKWLKSVHKYNDKPKPAILAWETVEDLLREKITYYWKDVSDWLTYHDRKGEGYLSKGVLKKVLDMQVLPISQLVSRCQDFQGGKVNYMEFIKLLGVDVSPGDVTGLSTQIMHGSHQAEMRRQADLLDRSACVRTSEMSADEVIARFKDKMAQLSPALRKAFLTYDKQNKGRITRNQFRAVLSDLGIMMSNEQFQELMARLNVTNGHMQYMDFIMNFGDPRPESLDGPLGGVAHPANHKVNPIRGDEHGMTALEVESKLRQKLRENFTTLRGAFYKFDDTHRGCVDKASFRRMLDSFLIRPSPGEFEKVCARLGLMNKGARLSYIQFLDKFEVRDTAEGHKWLDSDHRFNETFPPRPLTAEEAHTQLSQRAHRQWKDLSKAFRTMDSKGNGIITRSELRETLNKFQIPMEQEEFKKLWSRLDEGGKGYLSHQDFLQCLGAPEYAPADDEGPSSDIIGGNYRFLDMHNRLQQGRHEDITWNQANLTINMPAEMVERQLRDKIRDSYSDFYTAFRKYDTRKTGHLTCDDIQRVLTEQNFFINDDQFFALMDRIGLVTDKSKINYADFLNAFEDGRKSSYGRQPKDIKIEEFQNLAPLEAEKKLRKKLAANIDDVTKALAAFDKDGSGRVSTPEFRRVLDMFCFILSEPQWRHLKAGLSIGPDLCVDYNDFLASFVQGDSDEVSDEYLQSLANAFPPGPAPLVSVDEVGERLHEAVVAHYHNILRDFESVDYARIGSVTAEDLREVLARHVMRLNDDQFNRLWAVCPVNEYGNVEYKQFLKAFSEDMPILLSEGAAVSPPGPGRAPGQLTGGPMELKRPSTSASQRPGSRVSALKTYCLLVPHSFLYNINVPVLWFQTTGPCPGCREDVDNTGTISTAQFGDLLAQYGLLLPPSDFNDLVTKYDIHENGRFCYADFIRHFMLAVKPGENRALTNREKMPTKKLYVSLTLVCLTWFVWLIITSTSSVDDTMRRVQDCVGQNWKEMRREFRNTDSDSRGSVTSEDFRRILRQFNINLSEAEFQQLQDKYDKNFTDWIDYNQFLKQHLH
ncbi:hypothetical protein EGW08_021724 [Elysia chlorotica]|uniref:EF-hand domain-containing protein n=1 Tax=Elysia chlorotica TaxID=188477 RepID=A0A3S1AYI4_ELYCH|nr:hypothetical protein EGW08_021724 [Elysia chlorotica]